MEIRTSKRLNSLRGYAFAEVDKLVAELKKRCIEVIDFGVGDPLDPTPELVRNKVKTAVDDFATAGYPSYIGSEEYRTACAEWMKRRFGISLDADQEICSTIGSKEAIFNFPKAFIDPGDTVIIPSPGYPPMKTGTLFAGGKAYFVPLLEENGFLIDFESIPEQVAKEAKIIWLNYPNSPTGVVASKKYYRELVKWAHKHDIIIAADEGCYIDIYFDEKPHSILEVESEGIITFYSLSKRNNMTGYRVGFVAGDKRIVSAFKQLKTNIDSGTPNFIQAAAIAALNDDEHIEQMRTIYGLKRDIIVSALREVGMESNPPAATFYLWQKTPNNLSSQDFARALLADKIAIVVTPGSWISDVCEGGVNPGEGFVRFALVPTLKQVEEAACRIRDNL